MSYFTDPNNNFNIYDAPKCGSSTIRAWIYYAGTGDLHLQKIAGDYYTGGNNETSQLNEWGYKLDYFMELPGESICIKRDPVSRFISCYQDKVLKEGKLNRISIDNLLENFEEIIRSNDHPHMSNPKVNFLWYHFAPQAELFGKDQSYFSRVFDLSEVGTGLKTYLENKWEIELPEVHCRKRAGSSISITEEQKNKIKEIYSIDYDCGWY